MNDKGPSDNGFSEHWSWDVPDVAGSLCAVSDVLAATTNIARMLAVGARTLTLVTEETVESVRVRSGGALIVGESRRLPRNFFSVSNHPSDIFRADFRGKDIVYMSNNGTRVISDMLDRGAESVTAVSFVNISASSTFLKREGSRNIIGIAAGERTYPDKHAPEDRRCISVLRQIYTGKHVDWDTVFSTLNDEMQRYYSLNFWKEDVLYVLKKDTCPVTPVFHRDEDGTIGAVSL